MGNHEHLRKIASASLRSAMLSPASTVDDHYEEVRILIGGTSPLVFWRKWFRTSGVKRVGSKFVSVSPENLEEENIVLVDCLYRGSTYLLDRIRSFGEVGVRNIRVLTPRLQYTDDELQLFTANATQVWVTHSYRAHEERIDRLCPGLFSVFPNAN